MRRALKLTDLRKIQDLKERERIKEIRALKTSINDGIEIMALIGEDYKQTDAYKQIIARLNDLGEESS